MSVSLHTGAVDPATPVTKSLVEHLSTKKDNKKLKTFLEERVAIQGQVTFDSSETYASFLLLVKRQIKAEDAVYAPALRLFHKTLGLPEAQYSANLTLEGKDGTSLDVSKELLQTLFVYFQNMLASTCKEAKQVNGKQVVPVQLGKEALFALKSYLLTGKVEQPSYEVLEELVAFSHMVLDEAFNEAVNRALIEHFSDEKNEPHFDETMIQEGAKEFASEYLKKKGVFCRINDGRLEMQLSDFTRLFQNKSSKICRFLSTHLDGLIVDTYNPALLKLIPSTYRNAIDWLATPQGPIGIDQYELFKTLSSIFPCALIGFTGEVLRSALQKDPKDSFARIVLGHILLQQKKPAEAELEFRQAIIDNPEETTALTELAELLLRQNMLAESEQVARCAIEKNSKSYLAHKHLAGALYRQERCAEAEPVARRAVKLKDKSVTARFLLGRILQGLGKYVAAEKEFRRCISLKSTFAGAHFQLASTLALQNRYAEAEAALKRSIELNDKDANAYGVLGLALCEQQKFAEAEAAFKRSIELNDKNSTVHTGFGILLRNQKKHAEAEAAFKRSLELNDKDASTLGWLGYVLNRQRKYIEAEAVLKRAIKLNNKDKLFQAELVFALFKQEKLVEAKKVIHTAKTLNGGETVASLGLLGAILLKEKRPVEAEACMRHAAIAILTNISTQLHTPF